MRRALVLFLFCTAAHAEEAQIYGVQEGQFSPHPGSFHPAKSDLHCYATDDDRCYDGKVWRMIYPPGQRKYAKPATEMVACVAIMKQSHDCWDGINWYRLPQGILSGIISGALSPDEGAFITAPLH